MALPRFLWCLLSFIAVPLLHPLQQSQAAAQYIQKYTWQNIPNPTGGGFSLQPFWQPTLGDPIAQVVYLHPEAVFLEYNCYYMRDICKNVEDFYSSTRGQNHSPSDQFGYDLNTGNRKRSGKRRDKSCPTGKTTGWKNFHTCPEPDQRIVMRHDGPWRYKALEPGTTMLNIQNIRNAQGKVTEYSKIRYSCDEFPPATWVEGGSGLGIPGNGVNAGNAFTRCAAMRCGKGDNGVVIKAEQDWQGVAHGRLREELKRITNRRRQLFGHFAFFDPENAVILFRFRKQTSNNGIAARVYTYSDPSLTQLDRTPIDITQAKRSQDDLDLHSWLNTVTIDELIALGKGTEYLIPANDTFSEMPIIGGMGMGSGLGLNIDVAEYDSYLGNEDLDEVEEASNSPPASRNSVSGEIQNNKAQPNFATRNSEDVLKLSIGARVNIKREAPPASKNTSEPATTPLIKNATHSDLEKARKIVEAALSKSAELNEARLAHPLRNSYRLQPGTVVGVSRAKRHRGLEEAAPPLLDITDEIADAAALVSEADALELVGNVTKRAIAASGTFWMEHIDRKGSVPWGDDSNYPVFRNVLDYGAVGDGVTDDTKAIISAMNAGRRCGEKCNGSTIKNAIIYFPPGTYRVSTPIPMPFGTQVIGDANNWPTIVAARNFIGLGVLSSSEYTGGGKGIDGRQQSWFVNTANFYRQVRNIRIDITATRPIQNVACLHWQVAQATSLQNVELIASKGTTQRGIFAENGSGGVISDVTFRGGSFGLYGGNQQFTAQRLTFDNCATGVQVIWDWGWVWKSITMTNVDVGFRLIPEEGESNTEKTQDEDREEGHIGSASFIDSTFKNVGTAVLICPPDPKPGTNSTGVIIENVEFLGVAKAVADTSGATLLKATSKVDHWALGPVYSADGDRVFSSGRKIGGFRRQQTLLDSKGGYFERAKPQYEDRAAGDFLHIKDFGARGDGSTDDTAAFQAALYSSQGKVLFVDAGSYILTGTVTIPTGTKLIGETWSQLVASGSFFEDERNPKAMIKVGNDGDVGDVEMQDLLFTNRGPTAGLILVEWNIKARKPGSAALWDCHVRIGGATGTNLTPNECPPATTGINQGCKAASLMMHITPRASGYFENMWLWVADHIIDDPDLGDANNTMVQTSIYVARGLLVESQEPVWLYGTSSEHAVYYQYNFHNAVNVFAGMIQTESPYYQPTPQPPSPFEGAVGVFRGDPDYKCDSNDDFSGCDQSWAVIMRQSSNIFIAGAGLYSWFSTYTQECVDEQACQKVLMLLKGNYANVRIQHVITIGAKYMAVQDGVGIPALNNLNVELHPRWSQISVLDVGNGGPDFQALIWIDPKIWKMENPSFTCSPPCMVKLPPWTGATSVVEYPRVTVSDGSWTSTITKAPITISQWVFEVVTLEANAKLNPRQDFADFWPVPATTPFWPAVRYTGPDGKHTLTTPSTAFPTPPSSIGPNAPAPPQGNWPRKALRAVVGEEEFPLVGKCGFFDFACLPDPWEYEPAGDGPEDPYDERGPEDHVTCPVEDEATSTTGKPSPTHTSLKAGIPNENAGACYNSGRATKHVKMDNSIKSFCNRLGKAGDILGENFFDEFKFPFDGEFSDPIGLEIVISLNIFKGCQWSWNFDECSRYLHGPVDGCDCEGVDGKQGGSVKNNCYLWTIDPNTVL